MSPLALGRHNVISTVALLTTVLLLVLLLGARTGLLPRWVGAVLVAGYAVTVGLLLAG